jgi:hypothetical protein
MPTGRAGVQILQTNGAVGTVGKPTRVYSVELIIPTGQSSANITLNNGVSATSTATIYCIIGIPSGTPLLSKSENYLEGKLFPDGCWLSTGSPISHAAVSYEQDM